MAGKTEVVPQPKRDTVLFARVQKANKAWLTKEAKAKDFPDAASFVDALLTKLRKGK